ncbi:tetratricopeptide repeat protein [Tsuneonella sp. YG55]|uniref:Tetratricopeptide repeat protein n=1 Tax=Tsuneonella litorea TaxID=2976475 RepID=A0A9X2VZ93_9SPHN|nr:tetratricopeptide repeat protein [Tsuneonella litorea]MCT2558102.1 tetratricopeptide repeat protein [Tsuneonella litorea]
MISRRSLALALACALAGCGEPTPDGPSPDDWRGLLAAGDGIGAEAALRRAIENGTPADELAPWMGEAELQQGDLLEAERWLAQGAFAPRSAAHGFHMLGRLRMRQGDLPGAGQAFDKALATSPDEPGLWVDIGRLRWRGGEQAEAIAASERALAASPDDPAALLFRAQLLRDSGGNGLALPVIERGLAASPGDPDLLAEHAATLGELGRAREMLAATRLLASAAPSDPRALYLQAVLAARAGRYDLARSLLQRSGGSAQEVPGAAMLLAVVDMENGNFATAAQGLDALLRRQPDNRRVRLLLARALALGGNHRELIARFGAEPDTPYMSMLVGRAYEAMGEREKAAPYIDGALAGGALRIVPIGARSGLDVARQRGSGNGPSVVALVRALIAADRKAEARSASRTFLAAHPGSADAAALAGDAAFAAGDPVAAAAMYQRAAAIRRNWPLVKRMAAALERAGQPDAATKAIAAHLAGEPANADAAALLGRRLLDRGETQRASTLIDQARLRGRNDPLLSRLGVS